MARAALRHILLGVAATGLLAGCVDGAGGQGTGAGGTTAGLLASPARSGAAKDVEAPEVFQTTDSALWDGRPSLGGIWVASPDAVDPERVVMFNPATGKTVTGALFRRERDNPGPTLQISSDAAEALGILAGQPTEISVTALRKVEAEPKPEAAPEADPAAATDPEADPAAAADPAAQPAADPAADPAAAEAAAIAAAALDATGTAVEAGAEAAGAATDTVTEAPKRKTWKERRAEAKAKREAAKAAKAAEKAAAEAAAAGVAPADPAAVADAPTAETAGVDAIETAPLDARSAEATAEPTAAPAEEPRKTRRQKQAEAEAAAAAAAAAAEAPATATEPPAAPAGGRPIQIASFSKEENAQRAVEALAKIGITARAQKSDQGGKIVWGVVAIGDQALLAKIKDAGFADAYFLQ